METLKALAPVYEFKELLGQGTNGCVYRAIRRDQSGNIHQEVAIKVLNSKNSVGMWSEEFKSLLAVKSSRCVRVFGFEWMGERPALVLELIHGVSLSQLMRYFQLSEREICWIGQEIHHGLSDLRLHGLCHGDLSPANVMIGQDGQVRLLDFGLGNTSGHDRRLTPEFAAPEVLIGHGSNFKTDLWSLGQILRRLFNYQNLLPKWVEDLLCANATSRMWSAAHVAAPISLVSKVQKAAAKLNSQKGQTCELSRQRLRHEPLIFRSRSTFVAAMMSFLILVGGKSSVGRTAPLDQRPAVLAKISVRSNYGIEFELNGRNLGYAPIDVGALEQGDYILRWKFAGHEYERALTLRAGEHIVINDQKLANP